MIDINAIKEKYCNIFYEKKTIYYYKTFKKPNKWFRKIRFLQNKIFFFKNAFIQNNMFLRRNQESCKATFLKKHYK